MDSKINQRLEPVISEVKKKTGIDIQNFKPTFLERRILHRMRFIGISNYDDYVNLLSTSYSEAESLYRSFSINVTRFFRDPHVWDKFEHDIMPYFFNPTRFSPIYVWSCGSASGEEPQSISILLDELLKNMPLGYRVFATDINSDAIAHAKKGVYKKENLIHVSQQRLFTYFDKIQDEQFQIKPEINNKIEYERTDMMKSTLKTFDVIFCRNVLIYYDKNLHQIIFQKFFNMLKKDGILILGQDESMIGTKGSDFFDLLYPKERIYRKKA